MGSGGSWVQDSAIPYLQANLPLWGAALWEWITGTAVPTVVGRVVGLATALGEWVSTQAVPYLQAKLPEWLAVLTGWISGTVIPTITGAVVGIGNALVSWVEGTAIPVAREKLGLWTTSVASYVSDTSAPAITNVSQATLPLALNSGLVIATNESSTHTETWYEGIQRVLEGVPGRIQAALIPASYQLGVWIGESLPSVAGQMALWGMEIFRAIQTLPVTLPVLLFKAQQALWQWIVEATGPTVVAFVGWAAQVIAAALSFGASLLNALYGLVGTMIAAGAR
jgi:hypothetical protein